MSNTTIILGPNGHRLPDSLVVPEKPLIVAPEGELLLPPGAYEPPAPPRPERVAPDLHQHPLVLAPIIFAGVRRPRASLSERAKDVPGKNRSQKRRRAKSG